MPHVRNLLRAIFRRDAMNREMNDEMATHLAQATERLMSRGMSRGDAEAMARREFGNVAMLSEEGRDARGASWVETLRGDVRYALRSLRHSPAFTVVALLSLAIGIGVNTAIFGLIEAVVLRPLPVPRAGEIVTVVGQGASLAFTNPLYENLRDRLPSVPIAASGEGSFNLSEGGEERIANGEFVSGTYFDVLGLRPAAGRLISRPDDYRGCAPVAVVSHGFWKSTFGGRDDVVGSTLSLNAKPYRVIGVAPPGFSGITVGTPASLFVPVCRGESLDGRSYWWLTVIARRGPMSLEQVNAKLASVSRDVFTAAAPTRFTGARLEEFANQRFNARPASRGVSEARTQYAAALYALMGMVVVVLLISCANVANLMLARGAARGRELAIRVAVGASRVRLVRQMLTESALLAIGGAAIGVLFAMWMNRSLVSLIGSGVGVDVDVSIDARVLLFTAAVAATTVLLCGFVPAWRATLVDPQSVMKSGGSSRGVSSRFRIGRGLVVVQCAMALTVVVVAGLLVNTLSRLTKSPPGFDPRGVVMATVDLKRDKQGLGENVDLQYALLDGIRAVPGVHGVSITNLLPVWRSSWNNIVSTNGEMPTESKENLSWFNAAGPDYFRTMRTRVIAGREFTRQDSRTAPRVAILNEAASRRFFPAGSPVGKTFQIDEQGHLSSPFTVVGIVENAKYSSLRKSDEPIVYIAAAQDNDGWAIPTYVVRTDVGVTPTIAAIKAVAARIDPRMSLRFTTLEMQISQSVARERVLALLSASFGTVAFLLAMIGLYGVMAYTVARRRVEIGVRIALGAERTRVVRLVLGEVGRLMAIGIVVGGVGAYLVTPLLKQFLFGVEPNDPATVIYAMAILSIGAVLAGAIPARRAASLQPVEALRED